MEQTLVLVLSEPLLRRVDGHVVVIAAHRQMRLGEEKRRVVRWSEDARTQVHLNAVLGAIPIHTESSDLFFVRYIFVGHRNTAVYAAFTELGLLRSRTLFNSGLLCCAAFQCLWNTKIQVGKRKLGRRFPSSEDIKSCMTDYLMMSLYRKEDPCLLSFGF